MVVATIVFDTHVLFPRSTLENDFIGPEEGFTRSDTHVAYVNKQTARKIKL